MDGAHKNTTRRFPSYTLAELRTWIKEAQGTQRAETETAKEIVMEIIRRETGESKMFVVPQI